MVAAQKKADREERERQRLEWEEISKRRDEIQRLQEEERTKIESLNQHVENWLKSQQIRSFISELRSNDTQQIQKIIKCEDIAEWLNWALQQADRLDPLKETPISILDMELPSYY